VQPELPALPLGEVVARLRQGFGGQSGMSGARVEHMADDEPVEEHPNGSELLLDGRLGVRATAVLDERGDERRTDLRDVADAALVSRSSVSSTPCRPTPGSSAATGRSSPSQY